MDKAGYCERAQTIPEDQHRGGLPTRLRDSELKQIAYTILELARRRRLGSVDILDQSLGSLGKDDRERLMGVLLAEFRAQVPNLLDSALLPSRIPAKTSQLLRAMIYLS